MNQSVNPHFISLNSCMVRKTNRKPDSLLSMEVIRTSSCNEEFRQFSFPGNPCYIEYNIKSLSVIFHLIFAHSLGLVCCRQQPIIVSKNFTLTLYLICTKCRECWKSLNVSREFQCNQTSFSSIFDSTQNTNTLTQTAHHVNVKENTFFLSFII